MSFRHAIASEALWSGEKLGLILDGEAILLVHIDGRFHAYEDRCLHKQVPLSDGELSGNVLRCSVHDWEYDMNTGDCINPQHRCLRRYPVEIREGAVFIDTAALDTTLARGRPGDGRG
jgi:nitrite reductase/ring-hydroxylating ferredoxin subunit